MKDKINKGEHCSKTTPATTFITGNSWKNWSKYPKRIICTCLFFFNMLTYKHLHASTSRECPYNELAELCPSSSPLIISKWNISCGFIFIAGMSLLRYITFKNCNVMKCKIRNKEYHLLIHKEKRRLSGQIFVIGNQIKSTY